MEKHLQEVIAAKNSASVGVTLKIFFLSCHNLKLLGSHDCAADVLATR